MSFDTETRTFTGIASRTMTCWCSIEFVIPKTLYDYYHRRNEETPGSFSLYCPLGHGMVPAGPSTADKLRDELVREKQRTEQARADAEYNRRRAEMKDRQIAARKGQLTKLRKRVGRGVCPCCNRYFASLDVHMQTKHPEWRPEQEAAVQEVLIAATLTPPDGLDKYEVRAWRRGAEAWRPDKQAINPYSNHGRGIPLFSAWQRGLESARQAAEQSASEGQK